MVGCSKCSATAYQTYSYCISMHPDSIITPAKIAASLKSFAEKTGGKTKSEQTIRKHLAQLEKVKLVEREYLRDKDGQFLGGIWRFFSLPTVGQKIPMVETEKSYDKNVEYKEKNKNRQKNAVGKKIPPDIYKDRVRDCKTKSKTNSPPNPPPESNNESSDNMAVVEILKSRIKSDKLRNDFNPKTYSHLVKQGLTVGQMKTLIEAMNNSAAESCGWLVWKAKSLDPGSIEDFDVFMGNEKVRLKKEADISLNAKDQSNEVVVGFKAGAQMMREAIKNRKNKCV